MYSFTLDGIVRILPLVSFIALLTALESNAAQITVSGSIEGDEVRQWRTADTLKAMDIDGDNIYGTMGALNWGPGLTGMQSPGSTTLGWAYLNAGAQPFDPDNRPIDSIAEAPADEPARLAFEFFDFELTGTDADYLGKTVRIGVMADIWPFRSNENDPSQPTYDRHKGLQLLQTAGGTGTSPIVTLRPDLNGTGQGGNGTPEFYFWDLTGVKAGDQFRFAAFNTIGGVVFSDGYIGAVSFDIVPEPGSAVLFLAGALGLKLQQRRKA